MQECQTKKIKSPNFVGPPFLKFEYDIFGHLEIEILCLFTIVFQELVSNWIGNLLFSISIYGKTVYDWSMAGADRKRVILLF